MQHPYYEPANRGNEVEEEGDSDVFAPTVFRLAGILHQPESKPNSTVYDQLNST